MKDKLGLTHIYCGDGKGKTTAAMGIAFRSIHCGLNVTIVQFLKNGTSSEISLLKNYPNLTYDCDITLTKFVFYMNEQEFAETKLNQSKLLDTVMERAAKGEIDVLILDEIMGAIATKVIDFDKVLSLVKNKPQNMELIMTGRNPLPELIELSDYVSEIKKIKHPFDNGIPSREGIEY